MKTIILSILVFSLVYISNAQDYIGSFEFDGYERQYEVYLPQDFQSNMPLIVSIHGYSETVSWYKNYTFMHEVADTLGFVIVYPQGIGNSWNMGITYPGKYFPDTDDVGFISALIDTMKAHYDIDTSRIYCCGFSWGGTLTYKLICELGHRFAAFASVAGVMIENSVITCNPVRPFPIIHIHGTQDQNVPWDGHPDKPYLTVPDNLNFWLEKNSCSSHGDTVSLPDNDPSDGCKVEKISYTDCSGDGKIILYKIIGGGHSWPGTISETTWSTEGNRCMDINANVEILNFFKNHELASAQYVNIPDTAFLNALIKEGVDTNGDRLISYAEAEAVTSLDIGDLECSAVCVASGEISDLTGIEAFINLDSLQIQGNIIYSIDLSMNKALLYLNCSGTQLTNLDVSNNFALAFLSCHDNELTSLDVSNNTVLTNLDCSFNELTSLDVSGCTALTELDCRRNQLTSLDVSNNTALNILYCEYNELTSLDVSNNTALSELASSDNQLTSLDVFGCTALRVLDCSGNQLTSLDVSNNPSLTYLNCGGNDLTSLNVSNNSALKSLYIGAIPTLHDVCVWIIPFLSTGVIVESQGSPNVCFETDCNGVCENTVVEVFLNEGLLMYPNPTNTLLTIETGISYLYSIEITSLNGQLIFHKDLEDNSQQIDLSSLQKGVYFITIRSKDYITTKKIVKL